MDILQVLEGLAYVGFIAGAIFAVMELRDIKKDRRIDLWLRLNQDSLNRDLMNAQSKLSKAKGTTPQELEDEVGYDELCLLMDYHEGLLNLVDQRLIEPEEFLEMSPYDKAWPKVRPWVLAQREKEGLPRLYEDIEKMALIQEQMRGPDGYLRIDRRARRLWNRL